MAERLPRRDLAHARIGSITHRIERDLRNAAYEWLIREGRATDDTATWPEVWERIDRDYPGGRDRFVLGLDAETEHALPAIEWWEGTEPDVRGVRNNPTWTSKPGTVEAPHGYQIVSTNVGCLVRGYDAVDERWRAFEDERVLNGYTGSGFYPTFEDAEAAVRLYDHHLKHSELGTACTLNPEPVEEPAC